MRRVFAIDLLDIPCSRSCIIGFALIFLAMIAPSVRSAPWREDRTEGGGDTEPRIGRYGASESVARPSDTESVKRVLFKCRNTHFENNPESRVDDSYSAAASQLLAGAGIGVQLES